MFVLCIGLYLAFFQTSTVDAHSALLDMEPAEEVVIEDAPSMLKLRFNEPIEHDLAMVTIYDWNRKPVFTSQPDGDVDRAPLLEFSLPPLKQGTHMVSWDIVSTDGHPVSGSYTFHVGEETEGGIQSSGGGSGSDIGLIVTRALTEGVLLFGAGLFWFGWLAERRHFPALDVLWRKSRYIGAFLLVLGTISELVTYVLSLPSGIIQVILNGRWELLQQFPFILMLGAQIFFLVLLFIPKMERGWYLTMWLFLAVIPAFGGHVWGMESPIIALIPRVIHQGAIAFWLGALCYVILLLLWQKQQDTSIPWETFRPFFVNKMIVASSLVVLSGVMMTFLQTGITAVFTDWMTWSTVVIIKVVLTIVMLSLAFFQTLKWKKSGRFMTERLVRSEWIIGLVIIVLGVWMSQIPYPLAANSYNNILVTDHVEAEICIDKLKTGDQKMTAKISEFDGKLLNEVIVVVSMPEHGHGSDTITLNENDAGDYVIDLPFTMEGTWLLELTANYPNDEKKKWEEELVID